MAGAARWGVQNHPHFSSTLFFCAVHESLERKKTGSNYYADDIKPENEIHLLSVRIFDLEN